MQADSSDTKATHATVSDPRALIVQLHDSFWYNDHLCLAIEHLGINLLQLLQQSGCRGLSISLVRFFCKQLLQALDLLRSLGIAHCDLKPENILLQSAQAPSIKLIDFGSACTLNEQRAVATNCYVQSRFYRAPEIIMGLPYDLAIDMWSLGVVAAELFLGLPLFPGESEFNQLARVVEMLGQPPDDLLDQAERATRFFMVVSSNVADNKGGTSIKGGASEDKQSSSVQDAAAQSLETDAKDTTSSRYCMKREKDYAAEYGLEVTRNKQYFQYRELPDLIAHQPSVKPPQDAQAAATDTNRRLSLTDFIRSLLQYHASRRISPRAALRHPFITGEPFKGNSKLSAQSLTGPKPSHATTRVSVPLAPETVDAPAASTTSATRLPVKLEEGNRDLTASSVSSNSASSSKPSSSPTLMFSPASTASDYMRGNVPSPLGLAPAILGGASPHTSSPPQAINNGAPTSGAAMHMGLACSGAAYPGNSLYGASAYGGSIPYSTSPPGFYGSPPLGISPPSMCWLSHALSMPPSSGPSIPMSAPTQMAPAHCMSYDGIYYMQPGGQPPPNAFFGPIPTGARRPGAGGVGSIQLGTSPPDRSGFVGMPPLEGECFQCGSKMGGILDNRDGNLYCRACWHEYGAAGGELTASAREYLQPTHSIRLPVPIRSKKGKAGGTSDHRSRNRRRSSSSDRQLSGKIGVMSLEASENPPSPDRGKLPTEKAEITNAEESSAPLTSNTSEESKLRLSFSDVFEA